MRISLLSLCLAFLLFGAQDLQAQKIISQQSHSWSLLNLKYKLNDLWLVQGSFDWRREAMYAHWQQSLCRIELDRKLRKDISFGFGYDWLQNFRYGDQALHYNFDEHRLFQQLTTSQQFGRFNVKSTYRLEQRFLEHKELDTEGVYTPTKDLFRQRLRYAVALTYPINKKEMGIGTLYAKVANQVFFGFGKGIAKNNIEQNWFDAGLGYRLNERLEFYGGYLNQYIIKTDAVHIERNHTLRLAVFVSLKK